MLSKFYDFTVGDYEECRLLGYKNPVRTSQETVSATEPSRLMLSKVWGFTAVILKNAVFWDLTPGGCFNYRWLRVKYSFHQKGGKNQRNSFLIKSVILRSVLQLIVTAFVIPSSLILFTLMMEAIRYSEASVLRRATRRHVPEDGILHETDRPCKIIYAHRQWRDNHPHLLSIIAQCIRVQTQPQTIIRRKHTKGMSPQISLNQP
jgi:hypothetical protein